MFSFYIYHSRQLPTWKSKVNPWIPCLWKNVAINDFNMQLTFPAILKPALSGLIIGPNLNRQMPKPIENLPKKHWTKNEPPTKSTCWFLEVKCEKPNLNAPQKQQSRNRGIIKWFCPMGPATWFCRNSSSQIGMNKLMSNHKQFNPRYMTKLPAGMKHVGLDSFRKQQQQTHTNGFPDGQRKTAWQKKWKFHLFLILKVTWFLLFQRPAPKD